MPHVLSSLKNLAFGTDPRRRVRMMRSVLAASVYLACMLAQWEFVRLGLTARRDAQFLTLLSASGLVVFLVAIRSGWSARFADAALTMPQMVFALCCVAVAYHVNPMGRSNITLIVPLVLVFGAFILPARRCVQLGWLAVTMLGVTICYGMWSDPVTFPPFVEIQGLGFTAVLIPAIAHLAGQLSQLRIDQKVQRNQLRDAMEQLQRMATHDPLTGLPNRRHVDERIADVIGGTRRRRVPLCLATIDLDRFKRVNDQFGHAAGDEVLQIFACEASAILREGDVLARWGGEEFLLFLPATGLEEARKIVERMRTRLAASASWDACPHLPVTFSAGLALLGADETLEQALQSADAALYRAKSEGRDRTLVADGERQPVTTKSVMPQARRFLGQLSNIF